MTHIVSSKMAFTNYRFASLLVIFTIVLTAYGDNTTCPDGWKQYKPDKSCLKVFGGRDHTERLTWYNANDACMSLGGDLVQISDLDKSNFVIDMFSDAFFVWPWIGIKNNGYSYVDGTPLSNFSLWSPRRPKCDLDKCVVMFTHSNIKGIWYDISCGHTLPYVCSMPERPC